MEAAAYGLLRLKPDELERLQCHELELLFDGYKLCEDRENARLAYFTFWNLMPHVKKGSLSVDKILKPLIGENQKTKEELLAEKEYYTNLFMKGGK